MQAAYNYLNASIWCWQVVRNYVSLSWSNPEQRGMGLLPLRKKKTSFILSCWVLKVKAILLEFKCAVTRSELTSVTTHTSYIWDLPALLATLGILEQNYSDKCFLSRDSTTFFGVIDVKLLNPWELEVTSGRLHNVLGAKTLNTWNSCGKDR